MLKTALLAAAAAFIAAAPVAAATYQFSYSVLDPLIGGNVNAALFIDVGADTIATGIRGNRNGAAVTGLSDYAGSDNSFVPNFSYFTSNGLSYVAGGIDYNLFYNNDDQNPFETNSGRNPDGVFDMSTRISNVLVQQVADGSGGTNTGGNGGGAGTGTGGGTSAVPESATWAMMLAGFGMAGSAMRRRRTTLAFG